VLLWWSNRRLAIDAPPQPRVAPGRLPGAFWIAAAMLFCMGAAEWCISAWGATFVEEVAHVSSANIYCNGLKLLRICQFTGSQAQYHRCLDRQATAGAAVR